MIVFDLEYTTWEGAVARAWGGPGEHREIVQIGAVRLDGDWREEASLCLLVRPRRNPQVSAYFTALTGISQDRIDSEGIDIAEGFARFAGFAEGSEWLLSNGDDAGVIVENARLAGLDCPWVGRCRNLSASFSRAAGRAGHIPSFSLPKVFGLAISPAQAHDALADARAVAAALRICRQVIDL